jgi:hypothetical protein
MRRKPPQGGFSVFCALFAREGGGAPASGHRHSLRRGGFLYPAFCYKRRVT